MLEARYSYLENYDDDDDDDDDDDVCVNVGLIFDVIIRSLFSSAAARLVAAQKLLSQQPRRAHYPCN